MPAHEANDLRQLAFRYRSYTPIPFILVMLVFARPTVGSMVGGLAVVLLGEALRLWGVSIAGSETRTTGPVGGTYLITTGPFAHTRNPLYVGNMLQYVGMGIMANALLPWLPAVALLFFGAQYLLIVSREEEVLAGRFGEAYERYCRHVPRFLPRLTPYRDPDPAPKTLDLAQGLSSERRTLQAIGLVTGMVLAVFLLRG